MQEVAEQFVDWYTGNILKADWPWVTDGRVLIEKAALKFESSMVAVADKKDQPPEPSHLATSSVESALEQQHKGSTECVAGGKYVDLNGTMVHCVKFERANGSGDALYFNEVPLEWMKENVEHDRLALGGRNGLLFYLADKPVGLLMGINMPNPTPV
mgnify:CR=1 FL=1